MHFCAFTQSRSSILQEIGVHAGSLQGAANLAERKIEDEVLERGSVFTLLHFEPLGLFCFVCLFYFLQNYL